MAPWNATKAKVQLRLSVQRLRTLQEKKEAQAKASRRDIATLLEREKIETARIKVENIIHEDIHLELLELLELYCELLIARFGLLDQNTREPDPAVSEGVCSIIHASPRTEIKESTVRSLRAILELHILRDLLMHKYGRDFSAAVMENRDGCVMKKLTVDMPSSELVDAYLSEIAKGYGVRWTPAAWPDQGNNNGDEGGVKVCHCYSQKMKSSDCSKTICGILEQELISEKQAVLDASAPIISAEDSKSKTPNLPDLPPTEDEVIKGDTKSADSKQTNRPPRPPPEDDFDILAKRFEALKRRS
ncbi:hypothetical protein EW146_g1782 [Bondarzewia mesenterica]|uniref:DUF292-domain-containing protein n=1 Tax=Bondarzewia mesenterica TaxID=1095465 RepID=A0A4S4M8Z7_9AGAM|nr:hypothetical protein EW146_g1782 [Bondarzewia mesenterica]